MNSVGGLDCKIGIEQITRLTFCYSIVNRVTASGEKLLQSLLVQEQRVLYICQNGRRVKSWLGREEGEELVRVGGILDDVSRPAQAALVINGG